MLPCNTQRPHISILLIKTMTQIMFDQNIFTKNVKLTEETTQIGQLVGFENCEAG